jgi:gliding motility-associated-like protein
LSVDPYTHGQFTGTATTGASNINNITFSKGGRDTVNFKTIVAPPAGAAVQFTVSLSDTVTGCTTGNVKLSGVDSIHRSPNVLINKGVLATHSLCEGSAVSLMANVFPATGAYVRWAANPPTGGTFSPVNAANTSFTAGAYIGDVVITVTDSTGACINSMDTVVMHILAKPMVNIVRTTAGLRCQNDTVTLSDVTTNYPNSVTWTAVNAGSPALTGTFVPNANALHPVYVPNVNENGITTLKVTVTNGGICLPNVSDSIDVNYNIIPVAKLTKLVTTICNDMSYNVAQRNSSAGTAKWKILSGVGVIDSLTPGLILSYAPPPMLNAPTKVIIQLTMSNPPCAASVDTISFMVLPVPKVTMGTANPASLCFKSATPIQISGTTVKYATIYKWTVKNPKGVTLTGRFSDSLVLNPIYYPQAGDSVGMYQIRLDVTNGTCPDFGFLNITINKPATANINVPIDDSQGKPLAVNAGKYTRCQGQSSITFSNAVVTPAVTDSIRWTAMLNGVLLPPARFTVAANIPNPSYSFGVGDTGITKIYLNVFKAPCGTATDSITIYTKATPVVNIKALNMNNINFPLCKGKDLNLKAKITSPNAASTYNYSWSNTPVTGVPDFLNMNQIYYTQPLVTSLYKVVVSDGQCAGIDTIRIKVVDSDKILYSGPTTICTNSIVDGLNIKIDPNASFPAKGSWSTSLPVADRGVFSPDTITINNTVSYSLSPKDTLLKKATIFFTSNEVNCPNFLKDSLHIDIKRTSIFAPKTLGKDSLNQGQNVKIKTIEIKGSDNQPNSGTGFWTTDGTGKFIDAAGNMDNVHPIFYAPSDVDYLSGIVIITYNLDASNCNQGFINDTLEVRTVKTRNVFTPNGDGINDFFDLSGLPEGVHLKIFNRWGKLVYEKENYDNSWDARDVPGGVYYYIATYKLGNKKGWVQVFKE